MLGSPIDRLETYSEGGKGTAVRNVPATLAIFDTHFPRFPVVPGVLILADMAQVARLCQAQSAGGRWRLAGVRRVTWRRFVAPGDRMEVAVDRKPDTAQDEAVFSGSVSVGGKAVTTVGELRLARA